MIFGSLFLLVFSLKDIHLALAIHLVVQCTGVAAIPSSRLFPFCPLNRNTESARRKNTPTASRDSRMSGHRYTTHSFVHPSSELLISFLIPQTLPRSTRFLELILSSLPEWRKQAADYPVIPWKQFMNNVRDKVNPLAADDHLKEVIQQLQLMGEVNRESHLNFQFITDRLVHVLYHNQFKQARYQA